MGTFGCKRRSPVINPELAGELVCSECKRTDLAHADFHADKRRNAGLHRPYTCETCWIRLDKLRKRNEKRARRSAVPDRVRASYRRWQLKRVYGLSIEQFNQMLSSQGGVCKICKSSDPRTGRDWHVDHDHRTGVVRGILCARCNLLLGRAQDRADRLEAAIEYLRAAEKATGAPVVTGTVLRLDAVRNAERLAAEIQTSAEEHW